MNKDLEEIKDNLNILKGYTSNEADELLDISIAVAERMAAEIEALKSQYLEPAGVEYNDLEEMFDEKHIDRDGPDMVLVPTSHWNKIQTAFYVGRTQMLDFKDELEKRPEVVRCVECKHKEWCRKSINKDGHGDMCPLSFCSAGQRRESEEGK